MFGQPFATHVGEVRVGHHADLLELQAADGAQGRDRQRGVLRIEHEGLVDPHAQVRQPVRQAGVDPSRRERLVHLHGVGRAGQHDAAAAHQELVDGVDLPLRQRLGGEHQQQVGRVRHLAALQLGFLQLHALAEPLHELGVAHLAAARAEAGRRPEHGDGLEEARCEALRGGQQRAPQGLAIQRVGQGHRHHALAGLQLHGEPERLGLQQTGDLRGQAVALR